MDTLEVLYYKGLGERLGERKGPGGTLARVRRRMIATLWLYMPMKDCGWSVALASRPGTHKGDTTLYIMCVSRTFRTWFFKYFGQKFYCFLVTEQEGSIETDVFL